LDSAISGKPIRLTQLKTKLLLRLHVRVRRGESYPGTEGGKPPVIRDFRSKWQEVYLAHEVGFGHHQRNDFWLKK